MAQGTPTMKYEVLSIVVLAGLYELFVQYFKHNDYTDHDLWNWEGSD